MSILVRKIGQEKLKNFQSNIDYYLDIYRERAIQLGFSGELKFKKENGNVLIFVELDINNEPIWYNSHMDYLIYQFLKSLFLVEL